MIQPDWPEFRERTTLQRLITIEDESEYVPDAKASPKKAHVLQLKNSSEPLVIKTPKVGQKLHFVAD